MLLAAVLLYLSNLSYRRLIIELFLVLAVAMDATGFKPTNRGDWRIINHEDGEVKREGYIKLMAGIDLKTLFRPAFEELKDRAGILFGMGLLMHLKSIGNARGQA